MLIYTGVRVGELLELRKEDLHLDQHYFDVKHSKTETGIRRVPIAEKVAPFFEQWARRSCGPYVISNRFGRQFQYHTYLKYDWKNALEAAGTASHTPHDTRHTCISLLSMKGVRPEVIRTIVGHKGKNLTEDVYTHFDFQILLDAINQI